MVVIGRLITEFGGHPFFCEIKNEIWCVKLAPKVSNWSKNIFFLGVIERGHCPNYLSVQVFAGACDLLKHLSDTGQYKENKNKNCREFRRIFFFFFFTFYGRLDGQSMRHCLSVMNNSMKTLVGLLFH